MATRASKAATRERFAASAWRLGCAGGYDAVKIRTIAEDVGVSGALIYSYFEDKASLMDALRGFGLGQLEAALTEEMGGAGQWKLLRLVNRYVQYMREYVWLYEGDSKGVVTGPMAAHAQSFILRATAVLHDGIAETLDQATASTLAVHLWLSLNGLVKVPMGSTLLDQVFVDGNAALCVSGVAPAHMRGRPAMSLGAVTVASA